MTRCKYVYIAAPMLTLLSCGRLLRTTFGDTGALAVAFSAGVVVWGAVWFRLCSQKRRPEPAVLSILPQIVYFAAVAADMGPILRENPLWGTLYALLWLGFIITLAPTLVRDAAPGVKTGREYGFFMLLSLLVLYSLSCFVNYYPYFVENI